MRRSARSPVRRRRDKAEAAAAGCGAEAGRREQAAPVSITPSGVQDAISPATTPRGTRCASTAICSEEIWIAPLDMSADISPDRFNAQLLKNSAAMQGKSADSYNALCRDAEYRRLTDKAMILKTVTHHLASAPSSALRRRSRSATSRRRRSPSPTATGRYGSATCSMRRPPRRRPSRRRRARSRRTERRSSGAPAFPDSGSSRRGRCPTAAGLVDPQLQLLDDLKIGLHAVERLDQAGRLPKRRVELFQRHGLEAPLELLAHAPPANRCR